MKYNVWPKMDVFVVRLCIYSTWIVQTVVAQTTVRDELFLTPWWNLTFSTGEDVSVDCGALSTVLQTGYLQWVGPNQKPLETNDRISLKTSSRADNGTAAFAVVTLTIRKVTENDSGVYTCMASTTPLNSKQMKLYVTTPDRACSFEGVDICGWKVDSSSDVVWHRHNGAHDDVIERSKGPRFDHTYGASRHEGFFMDIDVSHYNTTDRGASGRLISSVYEAHPGGKCLQFWMVFEGRDQVSLSVLLKPSNTSVEETLLVQKEDAGNEWMLQLVNIPPQLQEYQLVFEAKVCGDKCRNAVTSIDDVRITDGGCSTAEPWPDSRLDVRLVGGRDETEGRVEVLHQGEWGTVCSRSFGIKEATVICKRLSLNYTGALGVRNSTYGAAPPGYSILLQRLQCTSKSRDLGSCLLAGETWGITNCTHDEDAGVVCKPGVASTSTTRAAITSTTPVYASRATDGSPTVPTSTSSRSSTVTSSTVKIATTTVKSTTVNATPSTAKSSSTLTPSIASSSHQGSTPPNATASSVSKNTDPASSTTLNPGPSSTLSPSETSSTPAASSTAYKSPTPSAPVSPASSPNASARISTTAPSISPSSTSAWTTTSPGAGLLEAASNNAGVAIGIIVALVVAALAIAAVLYKRKRKGKKNAYITFGNPSYSRENIPANDFNMDSPLTLSSSGYTVLA